MISLRCFCLLLAFACSTVVCADLRLASGGKTDFAIVVDANATVAEKHAADELRLFLKQVTDADFPVVTTALPTKLPVIVVGPGAAQKALAADLDPLSLKRDGIVLESRGGNLFLAGDRPRGTLYAVYTFLEDYVGCHWWSSKASTIPHTPELTVPDMHRRYVPQLESRANLWYDSKDGDWAVRNKVNAWDIQTDEARGGRVTFAPPRQEHTLTFLVPPAKYGKDHPEYYSEIDGKRTVDKAPAVQLCVTNPEVKRLVTEAVLANLGQCPGADMVDVSQNDGAPPCQCANCKAVENEEGSPAGPYLRLVNEVAAEVARQYPNAIVHTLAYQWSAKPPRNTKPLPNVAIQYCLIAGDHGSPLTSEANRQVLEELRGWTRICSHVYVWDYCTNFYYYLAPFPNVGALGSRINSLTEAGVRGLLNQGTWNSPGADFAELRSWVQAKMTYNPELDGQALVDQFVAGYYGPAAPFISQYLKLLDSSVQKAHLSLGLDLPPAAACYTLPVLTSAEGLMQQAEASVKGDPDLLKRVQLARVPLRYIWWARWQEMQALVQFNDGRWPGPPDYRENLQTILDLCKANGVTHVSEPRKLAEFENQTIGMGRVVSPVPPGCADLPLIDYRDFQDASFRFARWFQPAPLVHDDLASDKVAAQITNTNDSATLPLCDFNLDWNADWDVYVSLRVEKKTDAGLAFYAVVADEAAHKWITNVGPNCADIHTDGYATYKIGTTRLSSSCVLSVPPILDTANVKALWVDRFWLVRAQ